MVICHVFESSNRHQIGTQIQRSGHEKIRLHKRRFKQSRGRCNLKLVINSEGENPNFEGDPVKAIEGLLKDVQMDSVTLQHESSKLWAKKVQSHVPC